MELDRTTRAKLRDLIRQKRNVDKFKSRRSFASLALELNTSEVTLRATLERNDARGKLWPHEVAYLKLMRSEYEKHRLDFEEWSYRAIARQLGINPKTAERWGIRMLREGY